jgi:hypothetical protein
VVAPVAVITALVPLQIAVGELTTVTVGVVTTVRLKAAVLVQAPKLAGAVAVNVYKVVTLGVTEIEAVVAVVFHV